MAVNSHAVVLVYTRFFFSSRRRHTRFDCDWSSDVCSSDLCEVKLSSERAETDPGEHLGIGLGSLGAQLYLAPGHVLPALRSEERRVGKECRSRWSPYH